MGAIRGILLVFVSVLLSVSLLAGNVFLTLSLSLDYDNIKTEFSSDILDSVLGEIDVKEIIEENIPVMQKHCENKTEFFFEDSNTEQSFIIPCDVIAQGADEIIDYGFNSFIGEIYYEDYNCGFLDCFEKTGSPLFLISEKSKNYWDNKFYWALLVSVVLVGGMFFLVEKKSNTFVVSGSLLIMSALPFMKLDSVLSFFPDKSFLEFLAIFFSQSYAVFLIILLVGIILLVVGIVMKLFGIGFKLSNLFSKKDKKISKDDGGSIIKKEVSNNNSGSNKINPFVKKKIIKKEIFKKGKDKKSK